MKPMISYRLSPGIVLFAVLGVLLAAAHARAAQVRPNVVFIVCDDLGWGDLGCYGNEQVSTPRLDGLAKSGMRLTQFYVNSPVCSPSRASLVTGQFCAELGIHYAFGGPPSDRYNSVAWLNPDVTTIYDVFKAAGYVTGHYGKWHLGWEKNGEPLAPPPSEYGIDESGTLLSTGPSLAVGDETVTNANKSELNANRAVEFIERHAGQPFFLSLWFMDPHSILDPTEEQMAPFLKWTDPSVRDRYRSSLTVYYAILAAIDQAVGRILDKLEEEGLTGDTIVIFSSDNGPSPLWSAGTGHAGAGSAGPFRGTKASLYEGGVRVPFIISWPGRVPENQVDSTSVVAGIDMLPSLAAMAKLGVEESLELDGEDMSAVFQGRPVVRTSDLFWDYRFGNWGRYIERSPRLAMRRGDWKLLMNPDGTRAELFDLGFDHTETSNVAHIERERLAEMKRALLEWLRMNVRDPDLAPPWAGQMVWKMPVSNDLP